MTYNTIDAISQVRYGIGVLSLLPIGALWLAEHILDEYGKNVFSTISEYRQNNGLDTTFPTYNSPLFNAMQ